MPDLNTYTIRVAWRQLLICLGLRRATLEDALDRLLKHRRLVEKSRAP